MKSDQEIMQSIRAAIDDCTKEIDNAPSLQYQIARKAKGEEPVVKKISASAILAIALIVITMTAALAAGLGLFGELSQSLDRKGKLIELENVSESVSTSITTEDGITIEIGQAYYEGNRVFVSYRLSGNLASVALYEGTPEKDIAWTETLENFVCAEHWVSDRPELQKLNAWLDGKGQRWGTSVEAGVHDGMHLDDGTRLDIIDGDDVIQEDGSVLGWREYEIPEGKQSDSITVKARLFRIKQIMFQDGSTFKRHVERGEETEVFFSLHRNDNYVYLKGTSSADAYQTQAELALGKVDMHGTVRVTAPEWANAWLDLKALEKMDIIDSWNLYQNGKRISTHGTEEIGAVDKEGLFYDLVFPRMDNVEGLTLVPEYSKSGEHPDEAISIEKIVK
jgi:hypothetical protein